MSHHIDCLEDDDDWGREVFKPEVLPPPRDFEVAREVMDAAVSQRTVTVQRKPW